MTLGDVLFIAFVLTIVYLAWPMMFGKKKSDVPDVMAEAFFEQLKRIDEDRWRKRGWLNEMVEPIVIDHDEIRPRIQLVCNHCNSWSNFYPIDRYTLEMSDYHCDSLYESKFGQYHFPNRRCEVIPETKK